MRRRDFTKTMLLAGAGAAIAAAGPARKAAAAPEFSWRMAVLYPRGVSFGPVYQSFADRVKAMSNGRIEIQVVFDGEGVGATEILSATRTGLIEMGCPYPALHAGELPAGVVELGLPGAPTQLNQLLALFYEGGWLAAVRKAYASQNCFYLAPMFQPGVYIITNREVKTLDDLKGLKLRSPGGYGKFVAALGVAPVTMAFAEVYTSLATKVIDGCASSNLIDYRDGKFYEVAKYLYPVPMTGAQVAGVIINNDAWAKLPDDLKAILEVGGVWHGEQHANKSTVWEQAALKEMVSKGLQRGPLPTDADRQRWAAAAASTYPAYEADPFSKELIGLQRDFVANLA
jgi:TRAP-type C4-dicarboxylate transport system substrate-binding protein